MLSFIHIKNSIKIPRYLPKKQIKVFDLYFIIIITKQKKKNLENQIVELI